MDRSEEKERSSEGADRQDAPNVARLAHELRTPLSAIVVLAEIMRDERLGPLGSPKYRGYAADIHQSAAQAMSILAGWLEAPGTADATGGSLDFVELDPGEVVLSVVSALSPLAARSGVHIEAHLGKALPRLIADRRSLRQMLDNLIANAMKFTPPGGHIAVAAAHVPGRELTLTVVDDGDGMTPAELERACSPASAPEPLRRRSGGSGTGLALVRALAVAGGANVRIESAQGRGSTVTIAFGSDRVLPV